MPEYLAPGVFIEEIERGPKPIEGVATSTAAFLGEAERGPTRPSLQIVSVVDAIVNSLATIVAGNISAMAEAVEGALNRILPVVIGFLAALLGLGGISEKIRSVIEMIQEPVNRAIDWVINLGVSLARRVAGLFGGGEEARALGAEESDFDGQIGESVGFSSGGESHRLWIVQQRREATVMMASEAAPLTEALDHYRRLAEDLPDDDQQRVAALISTARSQLQSLDGQSDQLAGQIDGGGQLDDIGQREDRVEASEQALADTRRSRSK